MPKRIIIIEDDRGVYEAMSILLEDEGYDVLVVPNGTNYAKHISAYKPHLIFLDMLLSGVDGRDICRHLKNDANTQSIPVTMISAHPSAKDSITKCGADHFLAKPFDIDELLDLAQRFTSKTN